MQRAFRRSLDQPEIDEGGGVFVNPLDVSPESPRQLSHADLAPVQLQLSHDRPASLRQSAEERSRCLEVQRISRVAARRGSLASRLAQRRPPILA